MTETQWMRQTLQPKLAELNKSVDGVLRAIVSLRAEKSILLACLKHFPKEVRHQYLPEELIIAIGLLEEPCTKTT